ncbi:MAG: hypothetical protein KUG56_04535 [Kordiimonadaceae bacterium]|nr:hypothetical protein [Kordiimonadaceae bacterium]
MIEILIAIIGVAGGWIAAYYKHKPKRTALGVLETLMNHQEFPKRKFTYIRGKLLGFDEAAIRIMLHEIGAVSFNGKKDEELWGLPQRNPFD